MPNIPNIPLTLTVDKDGSIKEWPTIRRVLTELHKSVTTIKKSQVTARPPTNIRCTPTAGGFLVEFTRSDGDGYSLYWSPSKSQAVAQPVDLGTNNRYEDKIGAAGVSRYYWVKARRNNGTDSILVGPVTGVTLALASSVTLPVPPAPSETIYIDQETGQPVAGRPGPAKPEIL